MSIEKHLEYRNAHCPGVFQFVIQSVEEPKNNLHFLYMGLHLYRSEPHIQYTYEEGPPLLYISCTGPDHPKQKQ